MIRWLLSLLPNLLAAECGEAMTFSAILDRIEPGRAYRVSHSSANDECLMQSVRLGCGSRIVISHWIEGDFVFVYRETPSGWVSEMDDHEQVADVIGTHSEYRIQTSFPTI